MHCVRCNKTIPNYKEGEPELCTACWTYDLSEETKKLNIRREKNERN